MGKSLQLNFKYVKPSLLKGPFRYSSNKKRTTATSDEDDVPDLASSSCASDQDASNNNKKPVLQVPQEATLLTDSDISEESSHHDDEPQQDEIDDSIPCIQGESNNNNKHTTPDSNSDACDQLAAVLNHQQEGGITADREQRLIVQNCIPANIILLPDYEYASQSQSGEEEEDSSSEESTSSLEDQLEYAESLIQSYQSTIRSNEHLIDSLHQTIAKTQEEAMNVMSSHKDLEEAVDLLLQEREEIDLVQEPKVYLKVVMAFSLILYFFGFTTEYPLIATVVVFLMEGFL